MNQGSMQTADEPTSIKSETPKTRHHNPVLNQHHHHHIIKPNSEKNKHHKQSY